MPRGSIRAKTEVCLPPQPDFSHQGTLPPNHPTRQLNTFAGLTLHSSHWGYNIVPCSLRDPPVQQAGCWCQGDATKAGFLEAVRCGAQMWALE